MAERTVLVVEDDPLLRWVAVDLFEHAGLTVTQCATADGALAYVGTHASEVACIFTDVETPGKADGLGLAQAVAERWPEIAVLVTSGRSRPRTDLPDSVRFVPKPWLPLDVLTFAQEAVHP